MMPTYVNIMSIYAMSNLHDISWGNRPSVAGGVNAFSQDAKRQEGIKNRYQVFRVNFLAIWVIFNVIYILLVETYVSILEDSEVERKDQQKTSSHISYSLFELFLLYIAATVMYKCIFGGIHILKFKLLHTFGYNIQAKTHAKAEEHSEQDMEQKEDSLLMDEIQNSTFNGQNSTSDTDFIFEESFNQEADDNVNPYMITDKLYKNDAINVWRK